MPTLNYNYVSTGGQPGPGAASQTGGSANLISFSDIDSDSNDNTAFLGAVAVNDTIAANGVTWTVGDVLVRSGNVQYTVSPATQAPPFGATAFTFASASAPVGDQARIQAGEFLSDAVDVKGVAVSLLGVPSNWTNANVSFQISDDNATFFDVIGADGSETRRTVKAGCAITLDPTITKSANYVKIRSGSRDHGVPQQTDVVLTIFPV